MCSPAFLINLYGGKHVTQFHWFLFLWGFYGNYVLGFTCILCTVASWWSVVIQMRMIFLCYLEYVGAAVIKGWGQRFSPGIRNMSLGYLNWKMEEKWNNSCLVPCLLDVFTWQSVCEQPSQPSWFIFELVTGLFCVCIAMTILSIFLSSALMSLMPNC